MPTQTVAKPKKAAKKLDPNKLRQRDVGSIEGLLAEANDCVEWFNKKIAAFAKATGGEVYKHGASMKKDKHAKKLTPSARAYQKAEQKGDYRYIKDMIRATVFYQDCSEVAAAISTLYRDCGQDLKKCKHFKIVEVKSSVDVPKAANYADINMIFVCPVNKHLCELQIHFAKMLAAKDGSNTHGKALKAMGKVTTMRKSGHDHYNEQREACKGESLNTVRAKAPHMQPATSFGGGFVQNKAYAKGFRALKNGQATYSLAHSQIRQDKGKSEMMRQIALLRTAAKKNAREYMAWLVKDDQKNH